MNWRRRRNEPLLLVCRKRGGLQGTGPRICDAPFSVPYKLLMTKLVKRRAWDQVSLGRYAFVCNLA